MEYRYVNTIDVLLRLWNNRKINAWQYWLLYNHLERRDENRSRSLQADKLINNLHKHNAIDEEEAFALKNRLSTYTTSRMVEVVRYVPLNVRLYDPLSFMYPMGFYYCTGGLIYGL